MAKGILDIKENYIRVLNGRMTVWLDRVYPNHSISSVLSVIERISKGLDKEILIIVKEVNTPINDFKEFIIKLKNLSYNIELEIDDLSFYLYDTQRIEILKQINLLTFSSPGVEGKKTIRVIK